MRQGFDEAAFRDWYARMADQYDLAPDPDSEDQFYDYRAAFRAGAQPDETGHWPSKFKKHGHPNEIVGGFSTITGERVPGTRQASEDELVASGWDESAARQMASKTAGMFDVRPILTRTGRDSSHSAMSPLVQQLMQQLMVGR